MGFLRCGRRLPQRLLDRTPLPQWCNRRSGYGHPRKFPLLSPPLPASSSPSSPSFLRSMTTQTESRQAPAAAAAAPAVAPVGGLVVPSLSPEDSLEVFVDGHSVRVPKGLTVLQACEVAGVDIPRFCYHPRLSVAGNCRMCLVEVEKTPKPVASCAMPALPGMKIKTNTPLVKKAREGVMEFLLVNHPLDCPICDQGGECDLQDQSMAFGSDRGRYTEPKRSVVDKNLGPLVKTIMTRCIQCTRCVRFATEIAGVEDLGVLGRGSGEEIGTYVENTMKSELSGNVIDICPVGALTSRPYAFTSRPWELKRTESIDVSDAVGANIRIDSRGPEVMRIIPRLNEDVNEEWLSDKARFCYDGLKRQRLNEPLIRHESGHLEPATWQKALEAVAAAVKKVGGGEQMAGIAGKLSDVEGMMALKDFLNKLGCESLWCEGNGSGSIADLRSNYLLNTSIAGLENADLFLLVGTQVRVEAPLVNLRIRKAVRGSNAKVAAIGAPMDLTYPHTHLGSGTEALVQIAEGRHPFCGELLKAKNPVVIVGASLFEREDQDAVMSAVRKIVEQGKVVRDDWNGFNVLHLNAANAGALELGFVPGIGATSSLKNVKFLYLLGADDVVLDDLPEDAFVVYQGHHGDQGVYRANVILPSPAYSEKEATYVNTEGRVQQTSPAVPTISDARDDWKIVRAISEMVGAKLPYDSVNELRGRMLAVSPNLFRVDRLEPACAWPPALNPAPKTEISVSPFEKAIKNFYMTNSICRASGTMAKCTSAYVHNEA